MKCYKGIIILIIVFGTLSCNKVSPKDQIANLNGYWEISKVQTAEGKEKVYNFNQSIDFIELAGDSVGVRKKLQPQLNGTFITFKNSEKFRVMIQNDSVYLEYSTPYDSWRETLISAKEDELILRNPDGNLYFYRPYAKLNLE
ncbi:lipocalin family protein [Aquimarina intermedia]|uniref:Lipocalin-like domain-containing protein n=1 Tax=Aquimarina intermedia TaxID=350814 RepID=A0A5S5C0P3_9FLAO|nr:lipocalin family protein [Aquimarina intermedia]TYP72857.1 hypothetical protein BD809_106107 [Aquimarina intermedia]